MKVTCKLTGKKIEKTKAFAIVEEGKVNNIYFKSKTHYKLWQREQLAEQELKSKLNAILGVYEHTAYPVTFKAKLKMWRKSYMWLEILTTVNLLDKDLARNSDKGLNYLSAIIDNNMYKGVNIVQGLMQDKDSIHSEADKEIEHRINKEQFLGNRIDVSKL